MDPDPTPTLVVPATVVPPTSALPNPEPAPKPPEPEPKPPEDRTFTQDQVNSLLADQKRKVQGQYADYGDLKTKAAEADRLRKERETENEKAIREATEKARAEARTEMLPQLVTARFAAAAAGRIDPDRLATLTEDIDMTRYLKDDGTVDVDKVTAKVEAWAPAAKEQPKVLKPDPTQGARNTKTTGTDVGREMFDARRKPKRAS